MNAPTPVKKLMGRLLPDVRQQEGEPGIALFDRGQSAVTMSMDSYRWVLLAVALVAVYYLALASDRYTAETQIFVKASASAPAAAVALPVIGATSPGLQDVLIVRDYIHSLDLLRVLDDKLALRAHYSDSAWDFVARLSGSASEEDFLDYYRSHVSLTLDDAAATLTINAQAFTPDFAEQLAAQILLESDRFINEVSRKIARDEIAFVAGELERAQGNLQGAREALLAFQDRNQVLDPAATGAAQQTMVTDLRARIIEVETELAQLTSFLNPDAAEVVTARERLKALEAQLAKEQQKLAGTEQAAFNEVAVEFEQRKLEVEFATDAYRSTLQSLEQVRIEANRKLKHLVVIQSPRLPDEALYPRRLYAILTVFVVLSLAYGIAVMIWATVQEHRDV